MITPTVMIFVIDDQLLTGIEQQTQFHEIFNSKIIDRWLVGIFLAFSIVQWRDICKTNRHSASLITRCNNPKKTCQQHKYNLRTLLKYGKMNSIWMHRDILYSWTDDDADMNITSNQCKHRLMHWQLQWIA